MGGRSKSSGGGGGGAGGSQAAAEAPKSAMEKLKEIDRDGWLTRQMEKSGGEELYYKDLDRAVQHMSREELVRRLESLDIGITEVHSKQEITSMIASKLEDLGFKANYEASNKRQRNKKESAFVDKNGNFRSQRAKEMHALMNVTDRHEQAKLLGIDHGTKAQKIEKLDALIKKFENSSDPMDMGSWAVAKRLRMELEG